MFKGFHDLLVSSERADVAASLLPHPWDSGGQTKLCFLHISAGFTSPSPLLPAQQVATCCACYMSSHHFQPTSPTLPRSPPCNCLQWSSDINVHKNLGCLLKMQIPGSCSLLCPQHRVHAWYIKHVLCKITEVPEKPILSAHHV